MPEGSMPEAATAPPTALDAMAVVRPFAARPDRPAVAAVFAAPAVAAVFQGPTIHTTRFLSQRKACLRQMCDYHWWLRVK